MARKSRLGKNYKTTEQQLQHKTTVNEITGCWLKPTQGNPAGYVKMRCTVNGKSKLKSAHRVAYELYKGPIPKGKCVMHTCNIRNCWNPYHLIVGTLKENAEQMVEEGRNRNMHTYDKLPKVIKTL
jgi:hypothetical protein